MNKLKDIDPIRVGVTVVFVLWGIAFTTNLIIACLNGTPL